MKNLRPKLEKSHQNGKFLGDNYGNQNLKFPRNQQIHVSQNKSSIFLNFVIPITNKN